MKKVSHPKHKKNTPSHPFTISIASICTKWALPMNDHFVWDIFINRCTHNQLLVFIWTEAIPIHQISIIQPQCCFSLSIHLVTELSKISPDFTSLPSKSFSTSTPTRPMNHAKFYDSIRYHSLENNAILLIKFLQISMQYNDRLAKKTTLFARLVFFLADVQP